MTIYRDRIRCLLDPEQWLEAPGGRLARGVSVVMADEPAEAGPSARSRHEPSVCVLSAAEARALASELLDAAELTELQGGGDER